MKLLFTSTETSLSNETKATEILDFKPGTLFVQIEISAK